MNRLALPLAQFALSALNHVLQQQPAARDRLRVHAGRQLRIVVTSPLAINPLMGNPFAGNPSGGSIQSDARIDRDGMLVLVSGGTPAAILTFSPSLDALFGILRAGPAGAGAHLKVEGDVMLAAAVGQVAQLLRWDFEEDLSGLVGDVIAHRIGSLARGVREGARGLGTRSLEALQRAATAPEGPLATSAELAGFAAELARLAQLVARLEDRAGFSRR